MQTRQKSLNKWFTSHFWQQGHLPLYFLSILSLILLKSIRGFSYLASSGGGYGKYSRFKRHLDFRFVESNELRRFDLNWFFFSMLKGNLYSQLGQELSPEFVEITLNVNLSNFFVEAGACDGVINSNTVRIQLEKLEGNTFRT